MDPGLGRRGWSGGESKVFWFFSSEKNIFLPLAGSMRIEVTGRMGRMGRLVVEEVAAAGATLVESGAEAVIDFTHASTVQARAAELAAAGVAWILGTTGLSAADQAVVEAAAAKICIVQAANFSPGVNLVLALARRLAAALPADEYDAEILDMHHRQKVDAPSGTALALGRAVATGRGVSLEAVAQIDRNGARSVGAIGFAALRCGQVVGEHTLLFASGTEQIALTHRAFDRRVFARGAVRAAFWTEGKAPGLYSMMDVLGMNEGP
jgi:4-hydroxy-tetrahydrodipicolinate reductase